MEKKLLALLITIPILSILISWTVLNSSSEEQTKINFPTQNKQQKIADTFFNKTNIINFGKTGLPKSKIIGDQLFHYPGEDDSEIINPRVTFFRDEGSPVYITADHGWINHDGTRVFLKGHTIIKREKSLTNQYSQLETPELTIWPDKEYVETDKAVKITSNTSFATGIGMKAHLDQEHYRLLSKVKVKHIPLERE
jgi:lipopolysaccharide export system protein LptC